MASYRRVISSKGQVFIPAELRQQFGLERGTPATWTEEKARLAVDSYYRPANTRDPGISKAQTRPAIHVRRTPRGARA